LPALRALPQTTRQRHQRAKCVVVEECQVDLPSLLNLMRDVLIVGPVMAAVCALLSVFVVMRRMAMISEAVAHASLGGIVMALLLGYWWGAASSYWGQELITGGFCIATALLIGLFSRGRDVTVDSAIGIFLVASVALGVVMLSVRRMLPGPNPVPVDIDQVLFGSINSVGGAEVWGLGMDVWVISIVALAVFAVVFLMLPSFIYTSMDEEMARVNGVKTWLVQMLLLIMVSAVIAVAARMVGTLMINALMILPGATARMLSRRFGGVLAISIVVGVVGVSGGLLGSICMAGVPSLSHVPTGPVLVLTLFMIFLATWTMRRIRSRGQRRAMTAQAKETAAATDAA
jgi:ABC-type Mn2+/Zn2+ transport system permease subunit